MIINKYLNRPFNSNIKKRSNKNKFNLESTLKKNKKNDINIEYKNLTLDKILGNNFEIINYNNNKDKNNNLKNIEIFNILESENEEESNLNSNYYKTRNLKLPEILPNNINSKNKEKLDLKKKINLNKNLPSINWNQFFYSTQFNYDIKNLKKPIKKENPIIKEYKNIKTLKKNTINTIQNFYKKKINLPNIKKSSIKKNINFKTNKLKYNIFNFNASINFDKK